MEPRFPHVIVRQSSLSPAADRYDLMQDVVNFVNHATESAHFTRDELPQDALRAYHVDFYVQQVNNGGHGQFAHNSRWDEAVLNDIREGLARIGVAEACELFKSLLTFSQAEPARFREAYEGGGFGTIHPFIARIDRRFFDGVGKMIEQELRRWIAGWSILCPLDEEAYLAEMRALPNRNPDAQSRERDAQRRIEAQQAADPIHQALRYVCHVEPTGLEFKALLGADPFSADSDPDATGTIFTVDTDRGLAQIVFVADRAAVVVKSEVCAKVPLDMVAGFLGRQGLRLPAAVLRGEFH